MASRNCLTARVSKAELDGAEDGFAVVPGSKLFWVKVKPKPSGPALRRWP